MKLFLNNDGKIDIGFVIISILFTMIGLVFYGSLTVTIPKIQYVKTEQENWIQYRNANECMATGVEDDMVVYQCANGLEVKRTGGLPWMNE